MGKKSGAKAQGRPIVERSSGLKKLSPQKRNEVNNLVEKLLKASSVVQQPGVSREWDTHLDIQKILEKLTRVEAEMKGAAEDRTGHMPGFLAWMLEHGAQFEGLSVASFPGYDCGLRAEVDLAEGQLVLAVPRAVMLTAGGPGDSPLGPLLVQDPMLQHMPSVALSLRLLVEKFRPDSFWRPYLRVLPATYTTVLAFSTAELQELKGSPTLESALKQCRNIARQYAYFNKLFQNSNDPASELLREVFTYEEYCWAVSTVMTRQNFVPGADGSGMEYALIPLWDMCNHDNGQLSTTFSAELDRTECTAFRRFEAGEQLFIFYGARSNCDFLVHNGFVQPDNQHDSLRLKLGVSRADPLQAARSELLARVGLPAAGDFCLRAGPEPVDGRLLAFLRVFSMRREHLDHWLECARSCDLVYPDCAVDTEVEARAWGFLLARINLLLSAYPTSLQEDTVLLGTPGLAPCKRLAVQMRAAEKTILHSAVEYAQQRLKA